MQIGIKNANAIISQNFCLPDEFLNLQIYKKDFDLKLSPLELRRMGTALKAALSLVESFSLQKDELKEIPIIFSSYSGEVNRCVGLLKMLKDGFVSPTSFSLSVLNATPAQMAIMYQNQNEISCISAKDSLEYGIIEAFIKQNSKAILINYEEYSNDLDEFSWYALGLLLDKDYKQSSCLLDFSNTEARENEVFFSAFRFLEHFNAFSKDKKPLSWQIQSQLKWEWKLI